MKYPETESSTLEFKSEIPKNDQIIKTIIGFCNRHGGKLILGVKDDGNIIGIDPNQIEKIMEYVDKMIYESTAPPIIPLVYTRQILDKKVIIIEVTSGMNKPYYYLSKGIAEGTYIRIGRSTLKANQAIIEELKWSSRGLHYDQMPVYHATYQVLDHKKIINFLKSRKKLTLLDKSNIQITDEILKSYNIIIDEHGNKYPTNAGILAFSNNPQTYLSEAMILANHFSGISGRNSLKARDITGTIFEQYTAAYDFIVEELTYTFKFEDQKRVDKLEIPPIAIREALLNAIVHRNYHIPAPIKIAIYNNRIEIYSPGGFPGPLNSNNLRQGITFLRNPAICKLFREAGYIEKLGTGIITIFDSYQEYNLQEPKIIEGENFIKYILPRKLLSDDQNQGTPNTHDEEILISNKKILEAFEYANELSISELTKYTNIPRSTLGRKLKVLHEQGIIKQQGKGRAIKYIKN